MNNSEIPTVIGMPRGSPETQQFCRQIPNIVE